MDESSPELYMVLPDDLARLLVAEGLAEYYFQETRDAALVPLLIVAAASSAVTVVAADVTAHLLERIGNSIGAWRSKRLKSMEENTADITIEVVSSKRVTITFQSTKPESEVSSAIVNALGQLTGELEAGRASQEAEPPAP